MVGEFFIPKNITVGSKEPICIVNTLFYSSSSLILVLLNPHLRSILVNTFLLLMLLINLVSKQAHFILTYMTVTAEEAARFFLHQVWKLHGLLKCVVLDCRPQFVTRFTRELYHLLGIKLTSSIAWHPQTDRQTERVNQELDQYLWLFVNE